MIHTAILVGICMIGLGAFIGLTVYVAVKFG
jgi:hypothetical protein